VRAHHETSSGDGNPSTDVDLLVESLNNATRPHARLEQPGNGTRSEAIVSPERRRNKVSKPRERRGNRRKK
jgi:hypothetical protein